MNELTASQNHLGALGGQDLPIGVMAILDEGLNKKLENAARRMASAVGMVPPHLIDKPVTCYAIVTRALTWRLDPFAVAQSTYTVPGGKIAYGGKLVQAILENSGRIEGGIEFEHYGDWSKVEGKFKKNEKVFVPTYTEADEQGVGVIVRAKIKGEAKKREINVSLRSCHPRNSTLWALRPKQQICYAAVRVFANLAVPSLFMGVPFSTDMAGETMIDITPAAEATRPVRESFVEAEGDAQTLEQSTTEEISEDNAAEEFSVADAFEQGRNAHAEKRALRAVPPEWRDNPAMQKYAEAWQEGWKSADEESNS